MGAIIEIEQAEVHLSLARFPHMKRDICKCGQDRDYVGKKRRTKYCPYTLDL